MAKAIEHGLNKINEIYDQGDLMCELSRTTILTQKTTDDGGQAYGKINVVKETQWDPIKIPQDVLLEKCMLLGSDQIVGVVSGKRLSVYDIHGHHVRLIDVNKEGRVKTVENINAIAVITDKILVAESKPHNDLIHVVEFPAEKAVMSLTIDEKIAGIIPVRNGLVLVRLKEKIQAVDYAHYPRVDITDAITYGRNVSNMCVKGGNDELYVMFVKAVTPKILEVHVLDDEYQQLHKTKITHTTSIYSLTAVYTSQGPGFLVIQMGSTISTYKCSFGLIKKGPRKMSELVSPVKKKFYGERQFQPTTVPTSDTDVDDSEESQDKRNKDDEELAEPAPNTTPVEPKSFEPVIIDPNDPNPSVKEKRYIDKDDEELAEPAPNTTSVKPKSYEPVIVDPKDANTSGNEKSKTGGDAVVHEKTTSLKPTRQSIPNVATLQEKNKMSSTVKHTKKGNQVVRKAAQTKPQPDNIPGNSSGAHKMPDKQNSIPVFKSSDIGEEGGDIKSQKYGISLCIQPGAIAKGQREMIVVGLSRETPTSGASEGGVSISPVIFSEPSGLQLEKPARINGLQHCLSSWSDDMHVKVHELVDDGQRRTWVETDKGAKCSIEKNGELALEVTRLGKYSLTVMASEVSKKLFCRPFIPKKMPTTKKPIINVLIYDLTDGMKTMMMEELEKESPYPVVPAHIGKNFTFNLKGQDSSEVELTCHAFGFRGVKSLPASELIDFKSNLVDFQVDCSDGRAQDITIELSFGNNKIDMICHLDIPRDVEAEETPSKTPDYRPSKPTSSSDVPSQVLHEMAGEVPHNYYIPLGLNLGLEKARLDSILVSCANDSKEATYKTMEAWKNRIGVNNREELRDILAASDLKRIAEKFLN